MTTYMTYYDPDDPFKQGIQILSDATNLGDGVWTFTGSIPVGSRVLRGTRIYQVTAPGVMASV